MEKKEYKEPKSRFVRIDESQLCAATGGGNTSGGSGTGGDGNNDPFGDGTSTGTVPDMESGGGDEDP